MKKLFLFLLIISFVRISGQEKRVDFTKKLKYEFTSKLKKDKLPPFNSSPSFQFDNYISSNNEFFTIADVKIYKLNIYSEKDFSSLVNIEFNNRLSSNNMMMNSFMTFFDEDEMATQKYAATKLNKTETILGIPCEQFVLKPVFVEGLGNEEKDKDNLKVCVNEKYNLNNFSVLSSVFSLLQPTKKVEFNISGLILKIGTEKEYDNENISLKSIEDSKDYVLIDVKKALLDQKNVSDSLKVLRKKWQNQYISDSAAVAIDSVAVADSAFAYDYDKIPDYKSTYKIEPKRDTMNLAINDSYSKKWLNGIPKYCSKIDKDIPTFEMKDLDYHVKNYVGQMCDMYLTQSRDHSVGVKITLDEIRREAIFLRKIREKLSEKDRKKLDKYLDNLD